MENTENTGAATPVDTEAAIHAFKPSLDFFTLAELEAEVALRKDAIYNEAENRRDHA